MRIALAGVVLLITATVVCAQTTTADGVEAFVRGDYQRAAEILKPIAENSAEPEYAARFLMAAMYENGLGVVGDRMRACAMYMLAAHPMRPTPFAAAAGTLVRGMFDSMTKEEFADCEFFAALGFDHGFQPVTFTLEFGHSISWDFKGVTIVYAGKETRIDRSFSSSRGTVFLPLHYTPLSVGPSRLTRRHFVELSWWEPARDRQTWTLTWALFEVVRNELIGIAFETPLTLSGQQPPAAPPFDVHQFARVRVNDIGDPEWVLPAGSRPDVHLIESDAERQEVQQEKLARTEAEARVDWKRERDVQRTPELTYSDASGCGNVFWYGWSDDRTEAIAVRADKNALQLSTTAQTFDIAALQTGLEVVVHLYERPMRSWPFCTDLGMPGLTTETWRAMRGRVTIELSSPGVRSFAPHLYRATIRIDGAEFVNGSGTRVNQTQPITLTAIVGGMY